MRCRTSIGSPIPPASRGKPSIRSEACQRLMAKRPPPLTAPAAFPQRRRSWPQRFQSRQPAPAAAEVMVVTATLRQAAAGEWPRVLGLLTAAGLPTEDLEPGSIANFTVAADAGTVVGAVAVERYGMHGLLRSLVVDPP